MKPGSTLAASLAIGIAVGTASNIGGAQHPAGSTNAVLSFIDAAGDHVDVNRHWPASPQEFQVYPFVPYFWHSCLPGDGAIVMLLIGPGYAPPFGTSADAYTRQYLASLGASIARGFSQTPQADANLQAVIRGMVTPGDPAYESLKAVVMQVNDLAHYESYGYATFLFIRWKWDLPTPGCRMDVITVPEGYGIPYVAKAAASSLAATRPIRPLCFSVGLVPLPSYLTSSQSVNSPIESVGSRERMKSPCASSGFGTENRSS
jgi:hypothetical protein